jgi:hypothetical protein
MNFNNLPVEIVVTILLHEKVSIMTLAAKDKRRMQPQESQAGHHGKDVLSQEQKEERHLK